MAAGHFIDYDALAQEAMQEAMRGVVRAVLGKVSASGLAGEHHFYIAFNTQAAGVVISKRLKEKYPQEMTIVLQHRFWDLEVSEDRFSVKLTFDGIPERLVVPFSALKVFYDPSVPYGLQFEESEMTAGAAARRSILPGQDLSMGPEAADAPRAPSLERPKTVKRPRTEKAKTDTPTAEPSVVPAPAPAPRVLAAVPAEPKPSPVRAVGDSAAEEKPAQAPSAESNKAATPDAGTGGDAKVVDLSKFRKK